LDEAQKLLEPGYLKTDTVQQAFNNYTNYSKRVEKLLKRTSAEYYINSLVDFRQTKEEVLSHILDKYKR
jgi:hypothetical protein